MSIEPRVGRLRSAAPVVLGAVVAALALAVILWAVTRPSGPVGSASAAGSATNPVSSTGAPASGTSTAPSQGGATSGGPTSGPPASADPPPSATATAASPAGAAAPSGSRERPAVAPAAASSAAGGPTVRLGAVGHVTGQASGPGEIAGPAIRVTIVIENTTSADLDLKFTSVNAYVGTDRVPAGTLTQPGGAPLSGVLKPGEQASGVYLFTVPTAQRNEVTVVVDYLAGQPAAVFSGAF